MQWTTTAGAPLSTAAARPPSGTGGLLRRLGPGLLISVGYMDPGNWATDIEAGSRFGYGLLWVVVASSLAAMLVQTLAARLGIASGLDLAQLCRARYGPLGRTALWLLAETAIIATDLAEVLGCALAFHLLFGVPMLVGAGLTLFDTLVVLALQGRGLRRLEAIVLGLVATIGACFAYELTVVGIDGAAALHGLRPSLALLREPHALALAIGIVGATVMPHNLYLHSALVQPAPEKDGGPPGTETAAEKSRAIRTASIDTGGSLAIALLVNASIMVLAAQAFHGHGRLVADIGDAYRLLEPLTGVSLAAMLFGVALLASGQSSTITGTLAGQVVMEGFLRLRLAIWQRRLLTRMLALVPAFIGLAWLGDGAVGRLLVASQIVLSLQLPFALWPLLRTVGDRSLLGGLAAPRALCAAGWAIFAVIVAGNGWLLAGLAGG